MRFKCNIKERNLNIILKKERVILIKIIFSHKLIFVSKHKKVYLTY